MRRSVTLSVALLIALVGTLLAGCSAQVQPITVGAAPWADGETSTYDVLGKDGSALGTATWRWRLSGDRWTQAYEMELGGRMDRGEVALAAGPTATSGALSSLSAWRELSGRRIETTYAGTKVTIKTIAPDGSASTKELARPATDVDNDASLQLQRALPLAPGYAGSYTDVIATTGALAGVKLSVSGAQTVTVPAGAIATWHTVIDYGGGNAHDAWYGQASPHLLVKYRNRASGAEFLLRSWQAGSGRPLQGAGANGAAVPAPTATPAQTTPGTTWPPPLNVPFVLASILVQYPLMLAFPLLVGWWIRRRYGVGWGVFGAGALTFIASQVVHLPLNWAMGLLGPARGVGLWPLPAVAVVAGLSAGICEEGARWIVLTFFARRARGWRNALQYGTGHEAAEAIIFGVLALVSFVGMLVTRTLSPEMLGASGAEAARQAQAAVTAYWASPWYLAVLAGVERVSALGLQVACAVLVMRAVTRHNLAYLMAAILGHALVDAFSLWPGRLLGFVGLEAAVFVFGLLGLALIIWLREGPEPAVAAPSEQPRALSAADLAPARVSDEELARRAASSRYE